MRVPSSSSSLLVSVRRVTGRETVPVRSLSVDECRQLVRPRGTPQPVAAEVAEALRLRAAPGGGGVGGALGLLPIESTVTVLSALRRADHTPVVPCDAVQAQASALILDAMQKGLLPPASVLAALDVLRPLSPDVLAAVRRYFKTHVLEAGLPDPHSFFLRVCGSLGGDADATLDGMAADGVRHGAAAAAAKGTRALGSEEGGVVTAVAGYCVAYRGGGVGAGFVEAAVAALAALLRRRRPCAALRHAQAMRGVGALGYLARHCARLGARRASLLREFEACAAPLLRLFALTTPRAVSSSTSAVKGDDDRRRRRSRHGGGGEEAAATVAKALDAFCTVPGFFAPEKSGNAGLLVGFFAAFRRVGGSGSGSGGRLPEEEAPFHAVFPAPGTVARATLSAPLLQLLCHGGETPADADTTLLFPPLLATTFAADASAAGGGKEGRQPRQAATAAASVRPLRGHELLGRGGAGLAAVEAVARGVVEGAGVRAAAADVAALCALCRSVARCVALGKEAAASRTVGLLVEAVLLEVRRWLLLLRGVAGGTAAEAAAGDTRRLLLALFYVAEAVDTLRTRRHGGDGFVLSLSRLLGETVGELSRPPDAHVATESVAWLGVLAALCGARDGGGGGDTAAAPRLMSYTPLSLGGRPSVQTCAMLARWLLLHRRLGLHEAAAKGCVGDGSRTALEQHYNAVVGVAARGLEEVEKQEAAAAAQSRCYLGYVVASQLYEVAGELGVVVRGTSASATACLLARLPAAHASLCERLKARGGGGGGGAAAPTSSPPRVTPREAAALSGRTARLVWGVVATHTHRMLQEVEVHLCAVLLASTLGRRALGRAGAGAAARAAAAEGTWLLGASGSDVRRVTWATSLFTKTAGKQAVFERVEKLNLQELARSGMTEEWLDGCTVCLDRMRVDPRLLALAYAEAQAAVPPRWPLGGGDGAETTKARARLPPTRHSSRKNKNNRPHAARLDAFAERFAAQAAYGVSAGSQCAGVGGGGGGLDEESAATSGGLCLPAPSVASEGGAWGCGGA